MERLSNSPSGPATTLRTAHGFRHGQFVALGKDDDRPLRDLLLAMLNNTGIATVTFSPSQREY